jgi:hypothetical protein
MSDIIRNDYVSDNNNLELYAGQETIKSINNKKYQIIYGRRGTGKTHLLKAYKETLISNFEIDKIYPVYIDLRTFLPLLSSGNYNCVESAIAIFMSIVNEIVDILVDNIEFICGTQDINELFSAEKKKRQELENLLLEFQYEFNGQQFEKIKDVKLSIEETFKIEDKFNIKLGNSNEISLKADDKLERKSTQDTGNIGYISFASISKNLSKITSILGLTRVICILDEWSEVPAELQIVLADLIKKAFITSSFSYKIAAIPNRTNLGKMVNGTFIGLEDGGDIFPFNLDNRFIYELDQEQTKDFFNDLLYRHLTNIDNKLGYNIFKNCSNSRFINLFFANQALREILIASAGIPRDFISLLINSYDKFRINTSSSNRRIGVRNIRLATIDWYKLDKEKQVNEIDNCKLLLREIINEIIIKKKKTHFLIPQKYSNNKYLNQLIDFRVIHLRKKGYSHKGNAGTVYDVYSIDYGCYTSIDVVQSKLDVNFINKIDSIDNFREIRRVSLEDHFFETILLESGDGFKCPHCGKPVNINHPAYKKHKICNTCYEKV